MDKKRLKQYLVGGARVGGASNYVQIGTDGAITDAGTQSHDLNALTVTTLTNSTLGSSKTRSIFFQPSDFLTTGSVAAGSIGTYWRALQFATACPASETDSHFATTFVVPDDVYTSTAMNLYLYRVSNLASASIVHYIYTASYVGSGELAAPTGASTTGNTQHTTAASANVVEKVDIGDLGTGFAAGDLVYLDIRYYTSGGSQTALSDAIVGARVDYYSRTAY